MRPIDGREPREAMKFKIEKTSDIYKITKDGIVMAECVSEDDAKRITACLEKFEGTDTGIIDAMIGPVSELIIRLIATERELEAAGDTIDMFMGAASNKIIWLGLGKKLRRGGIDALKSN